MISVVYGTVVVYYPVSFLVLREPSISFLLWYCIQYVMHIVSTTYCILCLCKRRRIQELRHFVLQIVHDEDGTDHASVPKGGAAVKSRNARLGINFDRRLRERAVRFTFNISLHAGFDSVERMRQVTTKECAEQCRGDPGGIVGGERVGVAIHECASNDGWNGQVPAGPERLANGGPGETAGNGGTARADNVLERGGGTAAVALLLDHDEFQWRSDRGTDGAGNDTAGHFFGERQVTRGVGIAGQKRLLQLSAHGKLNHGATSHVDAVGADTAVHGGRIERNFLLLLHHVLGVIERL
jgi:hypothetical protein